MNLGSIYLEATIKRFIEYKALGDKTFTQLNDEELHFQPNDASNSIAIIVQHMHGNMLSRWTNFLTEDGEKEWRKRDKEFEIHHYSKQQLIELWEEGWKVLLDALASLKEDDLAKTITIRSQPLVVVDAINRQIAHYGYHVGQIVYIGRWIKNDQWKNLSIPKGASQQFSADMKRSRR